MLRGVAPYTPVTFCLDTKSNEKNQGSDGYCYKLQHLFCHAIQAVPFVLLMCSGTSGLLAMASAKQMPCLLHNTHQGRFFAAVLISFYAFPKRPINMPRETLAAGIALGCGILEKKLDTLRTSQHPC